jgi:alkylation response protein AidB-like acyl-CoA dehydrogenase
VISFGPTEEQELIRDTVQEFALAEMRDIARDADEAEALPEEFLQKTWELGLVNSAIPEEYGGGGMDRSPVTSAIVLEELGYGCASLASAALAPSLFINSLLDFGTEEQKASFLPQFTGAEFAAGTLALQESTFAFDPGALRTIAEPKGDGFSLTGSKRLVPLGDRAGHFLVVARAGAREGLEDLDAFIVPRDANGLTISDEAEKTMGLKSLPCVQLELDNVEVAAANRLGGDAGIDGARLVNGCRVGSLALALGISRAMLDFAIPYAKERVAFGQPIAQKQAIAFMLADLQIEVSTMRWLVWKAASRLENGLDASQATTLARTYVVREAMKVADDGLQVFGGHGYIRDYPVEMWYRNARTVTVLDALASV